MKDLSEYNSSDIVEAMLALMEKKALQCTEPAHIRIIGASNEEEVVARERRAFLDLIKMLGRDIHSGEVSDATYVLNGSIPLDRSVNSICLYSFILKKSWMEAMVSHLTTITFSRGIDEGEGFKFFVWHGNFHYLIEELKTVLYVYKNGPEFNEV